MSDEEIIKVLALIDEAMAVFTQHNAGPLTGKEISVKSMLTALRAPMMHELNRVRETADPEF